MKTRQLNNKIETVQQTSGCCGAPSLEVKEATQASCCEQPTDDLDCCDKTESKAVNSEKTGCC